MSNSNDPTTANASNSSPGILPYRIQSLAEYDSPPDSAWPKGEETKPLEESWVNIWVSVANPDDWPMEMQKALKQYLIPELEPESYEDWEDEEETGYSVYALEAPSYKLGTPIWDGGIFDSYEDALFVAANYMLDESLDFGGNPDASIDFLADYFGIDNDSKKENETYLEWIQRVADVDATEEYILPSPDTGQEVYLENIDENQIVHVWEGTTIFHPIRGLVTLFSPKLS